MRLIISVLAILATLLAAPAFSQVKKWVDKNGVVHYEGTGPAQPKTPDSNRAQAEYPRSVR